MGALEAPQDKHGQEHRTGTSRAEQTTEAMAELGALEAMADGLRGLGPLGPAPTAGTPSTPPKKNSLGKSGGIRSPPGLDTDKQDMIALQG